MSPVEIVLKGVLMPMAAGLVPLSIGMRLWRRDAPPASSGWGLAIAVAITFAIALWVQEGDKLWELRQKWQWLWVLGATIAASAVALSIPMPGPRIPAWIKGSLLVALAGTFAVAMLKPPGFDETWDRIIVFLAVAGPAVVAIGSGRIGADALERGSVQAAGWSVGVAFWLAASALSGVVLASGFAKLAIPLGAIAALSMAAAVLSLRGKRDLGFGGIATLAATLGASALVGWAYNDTEIPAWSFLAIAFAPAAMRLPLPRGWWFAAAIRLTVVLLVIGAAAGTAVVKAGLLDSSSGEEGSEYDDDYGYGWIGEGFAIEPEPA
ncbi:MAG: hypothetical protein ACO3EP_07965 [Phycisphaerales bacterium]|jgi:hypothetical protein